MIFEKAITMKILRNLECLLASGKKEKILMTDATDPQLEELLSTVHALESHLLLIRAEVNNFWLIFGAILVFFMQTGFAVLEVGCVSVKNTKNILLKNLFDIVVGAVCWYLLGHALATGDASSTGGFIGTTGFFLGGDEFNTKGIDDPLIISERSKNLLGWFFNLAFAAASTTIISGATAERMNLNAYISYAAFVISLIYPFISCWAWNGRYKLLRL